MFLFFLAVCQSFSIGFFFPISGYFTTSSYDRKTFLKIRLQLENKNRSFKAKKTETSAKK
jgi:hypothetical protein